MRITIVRLLVGSLFVALVACGGSSSTSPTSATPWSRSGTGDMVFDMPTSVARVRIIGTYTGYSSNFVVWIGSASQPESRLLVNELLGTGWGKTTYDGTVLTGGGGVTSISHSSGVVWSFTEVR
jgi:hypothetical protein